MKSYENKKYSVHYSLSRKFIFSAYGIWFFLFKLKERDYGIKFNIILLLILIAVDLVIFAVRFISGRFAKISFSKDGFTFRKYIDTEIIPWDNVKSVDVVRRFPKELDYYSIIVDNGEDKREYLVEKYIQTAELIDLFYYKIEKPSQRYRFIEYKNKRSGTIILAVLLPITALAIIYLINSLGFLTLNMIYLIAAISIIAAALTIVRFYYENKSDMFKANKEGVQLVINDVKQFVKWDEVKNIFHETEHLGANEYEILKIELDKKLAGENNVFFIPVSFKLLCEVYNEGNH